ncbi:hypothetical protein [Halosegnis longus]|uniref:hypothetical protein n=1 Tax=Halosegnis longus TaxID=2216012 RepID=UPI00129EB816|nr:hypothetical protein [Halosegnis longus]
MFDTGVTGQVQLELLEEGIEDLEDRRGSNSIQSTVSRQLSASLLETVLPSAQERARKYVGEHASSIKPARSAREGNRHAVALKSDDPVVSSHEFGSGVHGGAGAYRIDPGGDDEALTFDGADGPVAVSYVVHPGVEGKRFLAREMDDLGGDVLGEIADEVGDTIGDAIE